MILYHTSNSEIRVPDIRHGRVNADFGQGFYLTPDQDFGCRWAWQDAVLNRYELDMTSEAAVTKLMWVLGQTENQQELKEYFHLSLCGEVSIP